ncbi:MaoC family dehydratase [Kangiella sediminilitoris]|uniref:MaoC domain protein dehydratase n=1 Tax=Kangiella sediminilitoris TaxID=1144748 RepID=A0A1B3BA81_9GAMM|nr:MaoC family dehydratase [Kangiella sediminilitoris]AOE49646.1 MaoC domain protein dehydratase [Kangiella sediminilitoris]
MNKANTGRFFEDFSLGQVLEHPIPRTITEADASLYLALTGNRFSLYCNKEFAFQLGYSKQPLDNMLVFHIAFGKTVNDISLNAVANLGYAEVEFLLPVFVGDTLSVVSEVIGLRENSNGKTGIVYVHSRAMNQEGYPVLSWKRWVMVHKKEKGMHNTYAVEPQLKNSVGFGALSIPEELNIQSYDDRYSGEAYRLDDYDNREWIDHKNGLTIDNSEHTMATKLYQNDAKVHFNNHQMENTPHQQRLVYGGHIISLCRNLTQNGLANAQWIAAINGGSHLNPSYAGDTIYAVSQVLKKQELGSGIGALRLRTLGFKNADWEELKPLYEKAVESKSKLSSDFVLDLDYTVLIPS